MNFLRKILLVAIAFVFVGNAEGAVHSNLPPPASKTGTNVLDFDTISNARVEVPAMFQPKIYEPDEYRDDNPNNNLRYVYFTVINNAPGGISGQAPFHAAQITVPNPVNERNIYFPADGHQPTTPEAGKYSCANIDAYDVRSPITMWYMYMFGYQKKVTAGYSFKGRYSDLLALCNELQNKKQSISKDCWYPNTMHFPTAIFNIDTDLDNEFWEQFKIIASDPVGRVLLYRILIETRRHDGNNWGISEVEIDIRCEQDILLRNCNRSIQIKTSNFFFDATNRSIGFKKENEGEELSILNITDKEIETTSKMTSKDICLFHEMLHWYQLLRDPSRYQDEHYIAKNSDQTNPLANHYYGEDPLFTFCSGMINLPDLRVILGVPDMKESILSSLAQSYTSGIPYMTYHYGDDLSENAYRCSLSHKNKSDFLMRWGHSEVDFKETLEKSHVARFMLAYEVAIMCFGDIMGADVLEADCLKSFKQLERVYSGGSKQ